MADKITFFPVGNGDMTLIKFQNGTNILIDCNIRKSASEDDDQFDCKKYLFENLPVHIDDIRYIDAFILTHHDNDHCRGTEEYFYFGDPDDISDDERILIKELIVAPKLLTTKESINDDAKKIRKEAKRRLKLYDENQNTFSKDGNRIQIIGYSTDLKDYINIMTVAGESITRINGKRMADYEFFVLGPIKKDNDDENAEINDTSIVLKISFKFINDGKTIVIILGGDETCDNWVDIINKNEDLTFDILLAPHHCSWHAISNEDTHTGKVHETISQFFENSKDKAHVISSSKPIKRNNDNPPSYRAKNEYLKHLEDENRFFCLGEYPEEEDNKPLILDISKQGVQIDEPGEIKKKNFSKSIYTPKSYG